MSGTYDPRLAIEGQGPPLILVAGLDGTGLLFYRQIPLLAPAFRVSSYALRDAATTMRQLVADLDKVVDGVAERDERVIIVGESFGGALAMSFALAFPHRIRGLVVLNSFPCLVPQWRLRAAIGALRAMPWSAMRIVRRVTASRLHSRHTHRRERERFLQLTARASREGYINRLRMLIEYDIRDRLSELDVPTLFLAANEDHLVPSVTQARFMAERVPGSVLRVLAGHGHNCLLSPDLDLGAIVRTWWTSSRVNGAS